MLKKENPMVPPQWKIFVGGGDFEAIGKTFFHYFRELGQLKPDEKVLDLGCGQGRMAIPLTSYLQSGQYGGLDTVNKA
jgi:methylase of polypeptide subunit release factors